MLLYFFSFIRLRSFELIIVWFNTAIVGVYQLRFICWTLQSSARDDWRVDRPSHTEYNASPETTRSLHSRVGRKTLLEHAHAIQCMSSERERRKPMSSLGV